MSHPQEPTLSSEGQSAESTLLQIRRALLDGRGFGLYLVRGRSFSLLLELQLGLQRALRAERRTLRVLHPLGPEDQEQTLEQLNTLVDQGESAASRGVVLLWPQIAGPHRASLWASMGRTLARHRGWLESSWPHALVLLGEPLGLDALVGAAAEILPLEGQEYELLQPEDCRSATGPLDEASDRVQALGEIEESLAETEGAERRQGVGRLLQRAQLEMAGGGSSVARTLSARAVAEAGAAGLPRDYGLALMDLSASCQDDGYPDQALATLRQALTVLRAVGDRENLARGCATMSLLQKDQGELELAEQWLRNATELHGELGDQAALAVDYDAMARILMERGEVDEALSWVEQALTIDQSVSAPPPALASRFNTMSVLQRQRGNLGEAQSWLQRAIRIYEELDDLPRLATLYNNLSQILQEDGQLEEALSWLQRAISIDEQFGNRPKLVIRYNNLSRLERSRGRQLEAQRWLGQAIAIARELGDKAKLRRLYRNMVALHESMAQTWRERARALEGTPTPVERV